MKKIIIFSIFALICGGLFFNSNQNAIAKPKSKCNCGDVNGDGIVSATDVLALIRVAVNLDSVDDLKCKKGD